MTKFNRNDLIGKKYAKLTILEINKYHNIIFKYIYSFKIYSVEYIYIPNELYKYWERD